MAQVLTQEKQIQFHGDGSKLFGIFIVNFLLTIVSLGVYYPWAKAALLTYFYQETEFSGHRFQFHGTGKEMFIGMLKAFGVFLLVYLAGMLLAFGVNLIIGLVFIYLCLIGLIPFALVEGLKYRYSRTSWNQIRFGYYGSPARMASIFFPGILLSILTLGIYSIWMMVAIQKETTNNTRFGDVSFEYTGNASELVGKVLIGWLLTILTAGIYSFWLVADLHRYHCSHTHIIQLGQRSNLESTVTGGSLFGMCIVDMFLLIFTLGLAYPWVVIRNSRYLADNLSIRGALDVTLIRAVTHPQTSATGEGLAEGLGLSMS